jgi:hypothetical protein
MDTSPVVLFTVTTFGFEELKSKEPLLVELGAAIEKLASPKSLVYSGTAPNVGLAF